jgi:2-haloacid dehalogenase
VWIHVAQSYFHDIEPAHALGITRVWVNRQGEHDDPSLASAVIGGLGDLPGSVRALSPHA